MSVCLQAGTRATMSENAVWSNAGNQRSNEGLPPMLFVLHRYCASLVSAPALQRFGAVQRLHGDVGACVPEHPAEPEALRGLDLGTHLRGVVAEVLQPRTDHDTARKPVQPVG